MERRERLPSEKNQQLYISVYKVDLLVDQNNITTPNGHQRRYAYCSIQYGPRSQKNNTMKTTTDITLNLKKKLKTKISLVCIVNVIIHNNVLTKFWYYH